MSILHRFKQGAEQFKSVADIFFGRSLSRGASVTPITGRFLSFENSQIGKLLNTPPSTTVAVPVSVFNFIGSKKYGILRLILTALATGNISGFNP